MEPLRPTDPEQLGPYRPVARLGAGGMGQVFLAIDDRQRTVAVKVIRPELASGKNFRNRFRREVEAARAVSGIYTASVVDADPDGPIPWLATDYIAGPTLAEAVAAHGPLPVETVLALGAGIAEALIAVHAAGLVHRDLKPSNVLLAADGPRVIDFGIVRASDGYELTRSGALLRLARVHVPRAGHRRADGPGGGRLLSRLGAGVRGDRARAVQRRRGGHPALPGGARLARSDRGARATGQDHQPLSRQGPPAADHPGPAVCGVRARGRCRRRETAGCPRGWPPRSHSARRRWRPWTTRRPEVMFPATGTTRSRTRTAGPERAASTTSGTRRVRPARTGPHTTRGPAARLAVRHRLVRIRRPGGPGTRRAADPATRRDAGAPAPSRRDPSPRGAEPYSERPSEPGGRTAPDRRHPGTAAPYRGPPSVTAYAPQASAGAAPPPLSAPPWCSAGGRNRPRGPGAPRARPRAAVDLPRRPAAPGTGRLQRRHGPAEDPPGRHGLPRPQGRVPAQMGLPGHQPVTHPDLLTFDAAVALGTGATVIGVDPVDGTERFTLDFGPDFRFDTLLGATDDRAVSVLGVRLRRESDEQGVATSTNTVFGVDLRARRAEVIPISPEDVGVRLAPVILPDVFVYADGLRNVTARSTDSSGVLWRHPVGYDLRPGLAVLNRTVFAIGAELEALNLATGKLRWRVKPERGMFASLGGYGNTVYVTGTDPAGVYAFNAGTGARRWFCPTPRLNIDQPVTAGPDAVYVPAYQNKNGFYAIDAAKGSCCGTSPTAGRPASTTGSSPAIRAPAVTTR